MNTYRYGKYVAVILMLIAFVLMGRSGRAFAADKKVPTEPQNGIPLVIVSVDETAKGYGTIKTMNDSEDHSVKCTGTVEIKVPEGWEGPYGVSEAPAEALKLDYIRGRGNSTWNCSKKPYKISLKEKADLFGMGASDDWALMAGAMDRTLIKNRITSWLGIQIGLPYTPQMIPVDVVMMGKNSSEYLGSYLLSETVKVEDSRVAIGKLKKDDTDNITGGYLLSIYTDAQNSDEPASTVFSTKNGVDLINKTPSFDDTEGPLTAAQEKQRDYIRNEIQSIEDMIMSSDSIDSATHQRIASKLDLRSVADYWWVQEFTKNGDAFGTSSTYFYKEKGGKFCFGPLWDFDLAWGSKFDSPEEEEMFIRGLTNARLIWTDELRARDPAYRALLLERWKVLDEKLTEIAKDGGIIDQYEIGLESSQKADYKKWSKIDGDMHIDYKGEIEALKGWIRHRQKWINDNLDLLNRATVTVSYEVDGKIANTEVFRTEDDFSTSYHPVKAGFVFTGWKDKATGEDVVNTSIYRDSVFVATFIPESEAIVPKYVFTEYSDVWISLKETDHFLSHFMVWPIDATDSEFDYTVSDEKIVSVDKQRFLIPKATGETKLTATTYNGLSATITVHVYDPEKTEEQKIKTVKAAEKTIFLEEGSVCQLSNIIDPGSGLVEQCWINYASDNLDVIQQYSYGVIMGLKPGNVTLTMEAFTIDDRVFHDKVNVIVTAKDRATGKMIAKGKTVKLSSKALAKKSKVISQKKVISLPKAGRSVTYKLTGAEKKTAKYFSVNKKTGNVTVKKGVKNGTYKLKVKIKVADSPYYPDAEKTVEITLKVM